MESSKWHIHVPVCACHLHRKNPDNKVHGANMGPICGRQDPGGPHVGHMNFAIWKGIVTFAVGPTKTMELKNMSLYSITFYVSLCHKVSVFGLVLSHNVWFMMQECFSFCFFLVVVVIFFSEEYNRTHSTCTTFLQSFHKCIPLAVAREAEAHRAGNRYLTMIQLEGSRVLGGYILLFPDMSSTLHSQNEWFNISGSDIYL